MQKVKTSLLVTGMVLMVQLIAAFSNVQPALAGTWEQLDPSDTTTPTLREDISEGVVIGSTREATGIKAYMKLWSIDHDCFDLTQRSAESTGIRVIGWEWTGGGNITCARFELSWSGNVTPNATTVTAEKGGDFVKATENSSVLVSSGDFTDANSKWGATSKKHAECPTNPADNEHAIKISFTLNSTLTIPNGLPGQTTGIPKIEFSWANKSGERSATGEESSNTASAGASVAVYNHPGGTSNTQVTANATHNSSGMFEQKAYNGWDDGSCGGYAENEAESTAFSVSKE